MSGRRSIAVGLATKIWGRFGAQRKTGNGLSWEKKDIAELVQASAFCGGLTVQALWAWAEQDWVGFEI